MSQSSALRDQPSMDEILASIRKIIDAGEPQSKTPDQPGTPDKKAAEPAATLPPPPANDSGAVRQPAPQSILPQAPLTPRTEEPKAVEPDAPASGRKSEIAAVVDAYLAAESTVRAPAPSESAPTGAGAEVDNAGGLDAAEPAVIAAEEKPDAEDDATILPVAEISADKDKTPVERPADADLLEEFSAIDRDLLADRRAKYDARFSETDDGVFREVGNLLRETVEPSARAAMPAGGPGANSLVSDAVSRSVSQSLASLSGMVSRDAGPNLDRMAEDMLRPMLQEWLDNNLPSLVERLVRAEIERIARGEPRVA